ISRLLPPLIEIGMAGIIVEEVTVADTFPEEVITRLVHEIDRQGKVLEPERIPQRAEIQRRRRPHVLQVADRAVQNSRIVFAYLPIEVAQRIARIRVEP